MTNEEIILHFRDFLIQSWPCLSKTMHFSDWDDDPHFIDDWMQANWELLVERQIESVQVLAPYGYGVLSEIRYSNNTLITHRVVCREKADPTGNTYVFQSFLTKEDGWRIWTPFDYVEAENLATGKLSMIKFEELEFSVEQID